MPAHQSASRQAALTAPSRLDAVQSDVFAAARCAAWMDHSPTATLNRPVAHERPVPVAWHDASHPVLLTPGAVAAGSNLLPWPLALHDVASVLPTPPPPKLPGVFAAVSPSPQPVLLQTRLHCCQLPLRLPAASAWHLLPQQQPHAPPPSGRALLKAVPSPEASCQGGQRTAALASFGAPSPFAQMRSAD